MKSFKYANQVLLDRVQFFRGLMIRYIYDKYTHTIVLEPLVIAIIATPK
jgi:hypothetical protein